jgi:3-hydroxyacyl-CoA dehydrogenase
MIRQFQATSMRIKYAQIPVVAAVRGMALGGGCEFQMHAARTVFALESYIGLVEAGVGLLPAGGGLKEIAVRVGSGGGDVFAGLKPYFEAIAMGKVSGSALEAKELKLARESDVVVFNSFELLHVAKAQAKAYLQNDAGQHAGRRLHFRSRHGSVHAHRHRVVRRRYRPRQSGGRGVAA